MSGNIHTAMKLAIKTLFRQARRNEWGSIALYGAGKHTRAMIPAIVQDSDVPFRIACILDDAPGVTSITGIPVIHPDQLPMFPVDAVVISSDSVEHALYVKMTIRNPPVPVIRLYEEGEIPSSPRINQLLVDMATLPSDWHTSGTMLKPVLSAIAKWSERITVQCTMETGAGLTTLLFSHISPRHIVFAVDGGNSVSAVRRAALFNPASVEFIEGPTQRTLPKHQFNEPIDMALIDGPHGYPFPDMEYYYIYPHLRAGSLLVVDDIHIPTIKNLFAFLCDDAMYNLEEIIQTTAFFTRTDAPLFSPTADGWWLQNYNRKNFPIEDHPYLRGLLGRE